ncbi:MAG: DUF1566 domain-containing protein [Mariprofundus sp.]|nr:DUF1566 domain-containing protein [Mariprofundus sp.]
MIEEKNYFACLLMNRIMMVPLLTVFMFILFFGMQSVLAAQICNSLISTSSPIFIDHADGTVTDTMSGLRWKRCAEGQTWSTGSCTGAATTYSWQGALNQAKSLNVGGGFAARTNWRVPNIKELSSLIEVQCYNPAINTTIFPSLPVTASTQFWSASPVVTNSATAWSLNYYTGSNNNSSSVALNFYLLLVSGGL